MAVQGVPNIVIAALLVAAMAIIFRHRVFGANDRTDTSWIDAWLKAIVIVMFIIFFVVYLPSYVMLTPTVSGMSRNAQDLIGTGLWGTAFLATLAGLWYAHRTKRV